MSLLRTFVPSMSVVFPDTQQNLVRPACRPLEPNRPHIGLLILFGPEVRAFLYSGLADRLARHCRISVITTNPASAAFSTLGEGEVHAVPLETPSHRLERFRGWNRRLHDAWMTTQGQARWRHEPQPTGQAGGMPGTGAAQSPRDCPRWLRTAHLMEQSLARISGNGKTWERLYQQLGLDCLIAADYASPAAVMASLAAARKNVATVVLTNSWKDVFAHPYVDVPPGWIGVAGQPEADHLRRASPHLGPDRIAVIGSLHLERFLRPGGIPGRGEFCRRAGLAAARPFVCYTAASPRAVSGEESIVGALLEATEHHPARPQVLLRLNPREYGERFRPLQARFAHCVVQKPRWEWEAENNWNAPLPEDLDTWVATVHHSAFNVSIPSTVTLEFAAMGRLTLNVCFDADRQPPQAANARYWDAPFYRQIRKSPLVAAAFSGPEFREMLVCRLSERGAWRLSPPRRANSPVEEAEKLVWSALAACRGKTRSRRQGL
jgi:hypothetical protein